MGRFAAGVNHLWHEPAYVVQNRRLFDDTLADDRVVAQSGLSAIGSTDTCSKPTSTRPAETRDLDLRPISFKGPDSDHAREGEGRHAQWLYEARWHDQTKTTG